MRLPPEPRSDISRRAFQLRIAGYITIVLVCVIFAAAFVCAWRATKGSDLVWGTVGEWFGALGGLIAAFGAVAGVRFAVRRYQESLDDKRKEQARAFIVVVRRSIRIEVGTVFRSAEDLSGFDGVEPHPTRSGAWQTSRPIQAVEILLENRSNELITDIHYHLDTGSRVRRGVGPVQFLLPGEREVGRVLLTWEAESDLTGYEAFAGFTDSAGHHWSRGTRTPLKEMELPPIGHNR